MLRGLRIQILLSLVLLLVTSAAVQAQAYGRVTVVVKSDKGEPLEGVKVTITCKDLDKYREEVTTNKKGKATVSFTDATRLYDFHFEYEDFQPADMTIKPKIRQSITKEVALSEGQVVTVGKGADESRVVFSPAERVFNEGVEALQGGDMTTAKTKFMEALEKNDEMAPAHAALTGLYLAEEDYPTAMASAKRYLELKPGDTNGLFNLYDAQIGLGDQDGAEATLRALMELDKGGDTVALIYNVGAKAYNEGNYAGAEKRFLKALELDSTFKAAMSALANLYYKQKKYQEAANWSEKHLAAEPGDPRSARIRWESYRALGDTEKAKAAFTALAAADPKAFATDLYNKGVVLVEAGNSGEALAHFQQALEADPGLAKAHYQAGVCSIGMGESAAAKMHLEKFIELAPDDPEVATAQDMLKYLE